jgi:transposase
MSVEGMGPCLAVVGSSTKVVFEAYVERVLRPSLSKGQVVVMDNLLGLTKGSGLRNSSSSEVASSHLPAALLTRFQSYRGSLRQDQGPP